MSPPAILEPRTLKWTIPGPYPNNIARPRYAIVREVSLSTSGGSMRARFSRANEKEDVSTPARLTALFERIGSGNYNFPRPIAADPNPQNGEFSSPLSLRNDGLNYVIYILKKRSWRFSHDYSPLTVSTEAGKFAYFEASHIDETGNRQAIDQTGIPTIGWRDNCIAAYLIANRWEATPSPDNYADRINLHVDILTRGYRNGQSAPSYIPLIIDPDIRYPGGSG